MAESVAKFERLMNLVAFLLASPEPVPFGRIRKTVIGYNDVAREDAVEKRFDRDKKELREIGIPVEYVASDEQGRDGYFIPRDQYFHHELDLSEAEAQLLALLGNAARAGGDAISSNLRSALLKMSIDSPLEEEVQEALAQRQVVAFSRGRRDRSTLDNLDRLAHAIALRKEVSFRYRGAGDRAATPRKLHPYGLGYREGEWYVVGIDPVKRGIRQFKVGRFQGAAHYSRRKQRDFEIPDSFRIEEYLEASPWQFAEGKEEWARVLFRPDVAWMVEENLRPGQKFERRADGSGVLSIRVRRSPKTHQRLLTFLAAYSGSCAVLSPPWLRKQAIDDLRALAAKYE
jgi:proteasome accessory factor B